jgi:hypothetical protein
MIYGKCQEGILALSPREGGLGIGELMVAGAGAGAFTSFVLYASYPSPSLPLLRFLALDLVGQIKLT